MKPRKVRVRLAIAGLGSALALGVEMPAAAAAPESARPPGSGAPVIYQKSRSFRVPFHFDPAERARRRELQLWISDDLGRTWSQQGVTTPDRPAFNFRCEHDGEFWLAVRTVDAEGRLHPADNDRIQPSMKVVVDTTPPSLVLEKQVRSASLASVRWEVRDDFPGQRPPILEYQVEGSTEWRRVPNDASGTLGVATWDSGYAEPLKVRATILDRAGNRSQAVLDIPSNSPAAPALAATDSMESKSRPGETIARAEEPPKPAPAPPPGTGPSPAAAVAPAPVASTEAAPAGLPPSELPKDQNRGQEPAPVYLPPSDPIETAASAPPDRIESAPPANTGVPAAPAAPPPIATAASPEPASPSPSPNPLNEPPIPDHAMLQANRVETVAAPPPASTTQGLPSTSLEEARDLPVYRLAPRGADPDVGQATMVAEPSRAPAPESKEIPTLKVPTPRFSLDYAVDHAGPDGRPAIVELWVTRDAGKNWVRRSKDTDRVSPVQVELDGEGTYGLSLVARDTRGLGDRPPVPGDPPQMWVEVGPQSSTQAQVQGPPDGRPSLSPVRRPPSFFQRAFRR